MENKKYTLYDKKTGEIRATLYGIESDAKANGPYVEGEYSRDEYFVKNGVPVRKDEKAINDKKLKDAWIKIRNQRNALLQGSDWTQLPDADVDKAAWIEYRTKLRNLPETIQDPFNPTWPVSPK